MFLIHKSVVAASIFVASGHHNKWLTTQMGLRPSQHLLVLPSMQSA